MNDYTIIFTFIFNIAICLYMLYYLKVRNKEKEHFETLNNPYIETQEKYVRVPYVPYRTSKNEDLKDGNGFCEIGDFLMQWGTDDSTNFSFNIPFKECYGAYIMPKGSGGGNESVAIKSFDKTKVDVIAGHAERPFFWFAFGKTEKNE